MAYVKRPKDEESIEQWRERMKKFINVKGEGGMTLEEVATVLGCTRERVRQIEKEALRKLKKKLALKGIKEYKDVAVDESDTFTPYNFD